MKILGKYGLLKRLLNTFKTSKSYHVVCGTTFNSKSTCPKDGWPGGDFGRTFWYELRHAIPFTIYIHWRK